MDAKHMPGPWIAGKDAVFTTRVRQVVATIWGVGGTSSRSENDANTRLIAAAPEMFGEGAFLLDRLDDFEREIEQDELSRQWAGHVSPAIERFRAAIAKATASR